MIVSMTRTSLFKAAPYNRREFHYQMQWLHKNAIGFMRKPHRLSDKALQHMECEFLRMEGVSNRLWKELVLLKQTSVDKPMGACQSHENFWANTTVDNRFAITHGSPTFHAYKQIRSGPKNKRSPERTYELQSHPIISG
ncbi:hypothetical protein X801_03966 [Opisthorchis viverrini]|uniref:Uncharacterized protein n=2 Tax=Opisthorchis viverrini TaxID=6198 RepID=A0A075A3A6_OPIVI|nr:hypothetical protein T265_01212 [Opisthorchis viverrini]KER32722.1 hypothetical protein T265_01212 [Opisthorchis viverrini]OON20155.1 hypothetical protein X801_03966 [Opisthorchis viverrini]